MFDFLCSQRFEIAVEYGAFFGAERSGVTLQRWSRWRCVIDHRALARAAQHVQGLAIK
jgi:hypothetical protein